MAISKRLRYEILRRDNHACRYCGATAPQVKLHVDHVIPQALGGKDDPTNLVTACGPCNAGKTSSMPNAEVVADVAQETFRQATRIKGDADQHRAMIFVHLYCTWRWSWARSGRPISEWTEDGFTFETHKLLDCGAAAAVDLTEAAYRAGANNDTYLAAYIGNVVRESVAPAPATDERFLTCVDAMSAWENAWDFVSEEGTPDLDVVRCFVTEVGTAYDNATAPTVLVKAAAAAGAAMSTDLGMFVSRLVSRGEN